MPAIPAHIAPHTTSGGPLFSSRSNRVASTPRAILNQIAKVARRSTAAIKLSELSTRSRVPVMRARPASLECHQFQRWETHMLRRRRRGVVGAVAGLLILLGFTATQPAGTAAAGTPSNQQSERSIVTRNHLWGTVINSSGQVIQHGPNSALNSSNMSPNTFEKMLRTTPRLPFAGPSIATTPFHYTFSFQVELQSRTFTSPHSIICTGNTAKSMGGITGSDPRFYVNLYHWHPSLHVGDSEGRKPIAVPIDQKSHQACWGGLNTSNQWRMVFENVVNSDGAEGTGVIS